MNECKERSNTATTAQSTQPPQRSRYSYHSAANTAAKAQPTQLLQRSQHSCHSAVNTATSRSQHSCHSTVNTAASRSQHSCHSAVNIAASRSRHSCHSAVNTAASRSQHSCLAQPIQLPQRSHAKKREIRLKTIRLTSIYLQVNPNRALLTRRRGRILDVRQDTLSLLGL